VSRLPLSEIHLKAKSPDFFGACTVLGIVWRCLFTARCVGLGGNGFRDFAELSFAYTTPVLYGPEQFEAFVI